MQLIQSSEYIMAKQTTARGICVEITYLIAT
jgi:hypothetical protein